MFTRRRKKTLADTKFNRIAKRRNIQNAESNQVGASKVEEMKQIGPHQLAKIDGSYYELEAPNYKDQSREINKRAAEYRVSHTFGSPSYATAAARALNVAHQAEIEAAYIDPQDPRAVTAAKQKLVEADERIQALIQEADLTKEVTHNPNFDRMWLPINKAPPRVGGIVSDTALGAQFEDEPDEDHARTLAAMSGAQGTSEPKNAGKRAVSWKRNQLRRLMTPSSIDQQASARMREMARNAGYQLFHYKNPKGSMVAHIDPKVMDKFNDLITRTVQERRAEQQRMATVQHQVNQDVDISQRKQQSEVEIDALRSNVGDPDEEVAFKRLNTQQTAGDRVGLLEKAQAALPQSMIDEELEDEIDDVRTVADGNAVEAKIEAKKRDAEVRGVVRGQSGRLLKRAAGTTPDTLKEASDIASNAEDTHMDDKVPQGPDTVPKDPEVASLLEDPVFAEIREAVRKMLEHQPASSVESVPPSVRSLSPALDVDSLPREEKRVTSSAMSGVSEDVGQAMSGVSADDSRAMSDVSGASRSSAGTDVTMHALHAAIEARDADRMSEISDDVKMSATMPDELWAALHAKQGDKNQANYKALRAELIKTVVPQHLRKGTKGTNKDYQMLWTAHGRRLFAEDPRRLLRQFILKAGNKFRKYKRRQQKTNKK